MNVGKALGIIGVVIIHISAFSLGSSKEGSFIYILSLIINQLSRFSVPLFVFFSGLGLALSYKREKGYLYFLRRRLGKVLPLYIFWGIVYLLIINKNYDFNSWWEAFMKGDKIFYHLYFMSMIIKLYIIFPILYLCFKNILGVFISLIISGGIITTGHYFNMPNLTLDFFSKRNVLFWLFYFILGIYLSGNIANYIKSMKKHKKLFDFILLVCIICILWETFHSIKIGKSMDYSTTFIRPSIIIYSIIVTAFLFSRSFSQKTLKVLRKISNNSYVVYLAHPLVLYYYIILFKHFKWSIASIGFITGALCLCIFLPMIFGYIRLTFKIMINNEKNI